MQSPFRSPLQELACGDVAHELAITRLMLAAVPEQRYGWRPHARSMTLATGFGIDASRSRIGIAGLEAKKRR